MGYVSTEFSQPGSKIDIEARGKTFPAEVVKIPFCDLMSESEVHIEKKRVSDETFRLAPSHCITYDFIR